jgi:hypothetical protein
VAEGAPLLRVYGFTLIEGSNPSLSAIEYINPLLAGFLLLKNPPKNRLKAISFSKMAVL